MKVQLGLKGSTAKNQFEDRLQYHPDVYEFFTQESDFTKEGIPKLKYAIEKVKAQATNKIVLHQPMRYHHDIFTELIAPQSQCPGLYKFIEESTYEMLQLSFDYNIQSLVHGAYLRQTSKYIAMYLSFEDAQAAAFKRMDRFNEMGKGHIMFENSISPIFQYGDPYLENRIVAHHYRLAFDTSHCFIAEHGNNDKLMTSLKHLLNVTVHYHLVDSMGIKHDSLVLGTGKIDWKRVLKILAQNKNATSIYEINLKDSTKATEQIESYQYLINLCKSER